MTALGLGLLSACLLAAPGPDATLQHGDVGASIYLRGVLGSGAPVEGIRAAGVVTGADAACVACHQRSGLGTVEGRISVPPITGQYLFQPRAQDASRPALPYAEGVRDRKPYDEGTLARAIRDGVDSQGRPLGELMPRYALGDEDMAALVEHLKGLDRRAIPGVADTVLHFATIVTPDADPVKRAGMLDVLEHFVAEKNRFPFKPTPRMWTSARTQASKSMYMANRHWQLHVWQLTGPAKTWRAQLEERLAAEPVYAVLSGLGGANWAPVHEFCEQHAIPCLLPNVEVPVVAESAFYPLYFSRGVLLEADLVARSIADAEGRPPAIEQVYRAGDSGEAAAKLLTAQLRARGADVHSTVLPARAVGRGMIAALRGATRRNQARGKETALVLWLREPDLAALGAIPDGVRTVYVSGLMGGFEKAPLPEGWRGRTLMTYPFDPPERRGIRLDHALGWFSFRRIPLVAQQVQTDTYLACSLLADVLNRMADNFARPYLVEQLQDLVEHRLMTGNYPHLSLASGQRFASKGGYVVRFRDGRGTALLAVSDWTVP